MDRSSSLSEGRLSLVHGGSYGSESPEDLRQMEEREYVKRIKDDMHERHMAYAYRSIHCNGKLSHYAFHRMNHFNRNIFPLAKLQILLECFSTLLVC